MLATGATGTNEIGGHSAVLDNTVDSLAIGNLATNALKLTAATTLDASVAGPGLASSQTSGTVSASSTLLGTLGIEAFGNATSNTIGNSGDSNSDSATVSGNRVSAQASGNQVDNTLALAAGTSLAIASGQADLANTQIANGPVVSATASGQIGIAATGARNNAVSSVNSVLGNVLSAAATGNAATNALTLQAGFLDAGAGPQLSNTQTSVGRVLASSQGDVSIRAIGWSGGTSVLDGQLTVSGNQLSADAIGNQASNTLSLRAATALYAGPAAQLSNIQTASGDVTATASSIVGVQAIGGSSNAAMSGVSSVLDNRVLAQAGQNQATNTLALNAGTELIGGAVLLSSQQLATAGITGAIVSTGSYPLGVLASGVNPPLMAGIEHGVNVNGNTLQSVAFANSASNLLTPTAATGNQGSATIANAQTNGTAGGTTGAVTASTTLSGGLGAYASGALNLGANSVITVAGNQVQASAYGNSARNVLNADGGVGLPGATLAGLNTQSNYGAINASVNGPATGPAIGLAVGGLAMGPYSATVLGNTVASAAYGNTAYNQLQASSSVGLVPTAAALVSTQMNGADVTARVSNMGIGVVASGSGTGIGSGTSVISGNTLSALAVGNASVNHMVIGN